MKIKIQRDTCQNVMAMLLGIARAGAKNAEDKTAAGFIVLTAKDTGTAFSIQNQYESLEIDCAAEVLESGSVFIPIHKFITIISNTIADEITISGTESLTIKGTQLNFKLPTKIADLLPPEWKVPDTKIELSNVAPIRALISRVKKALVEGSGPTFQSVLMSFRPGIVYSVAASNHKIAGAAYKSDEILSRQDAYIPVILLESVDRVLAALDGAVTIGINSSRITIEAPGFRYSCQAALNGPPRVAQLFETTDMNCSEVDSFEFVRILKLVSAGVDSDKAKGIITVDFAWDKLIVTAEEDGTGDTSIDSTQPDNFEPLTQRFKLDYLLSAIGKSKKLRIWFGRKESDRCIFEHLDDDFVTKYVVGPSR